MNKLTLLGLFFLILPTMCQQIHFITLNDTFPNPSIQFQGKSDDTISIKAQYNRNVSNFQFYLYALEKFGSYNGLGITATRNIQNRANLSFKKKIMSDQVFLAIFNTSDSENSMLYIKISLSINNITIRQHYSTVVLSTKQFHFKFNIDSPCKIKFSLPLPIFTRVFSDFSLFSPLNNRIPVDNTYDYYEVMLANSGKWTLVFYLYGPAYMYLSRMVLNITTFTQSQCKNYCSELQYPVVSEAQGNNKICVCDETIPGLLWDSANSVCKFQTPSIVCNNGKKEQGQECDTNGGPGCFNCKIQPNYICQQDSSGLSICKQILSNITISIGAIVGIAVGWVSSIILSLGIFYCLKVYKKKSSQQSDEDEIEQEKVSKPNLAEKKSLSMKSLKFSLNEIRNFRRENKSKYSEVRKKINPLISCCICLSPQCQIVLSCLHYFHRQCIILWLKKHRHCPLCQQNYRQSTRSMQMLNDDIQGF